VNDRTYVIAEAGVNHGGHLDLAERLVDAAAYAGADAVKFQIFKSSLLATRKAELAPYQSARGDGESLQVDMLQSLELSDRDFRSLHARASNLGIEFLASAFDSTSLQFIIETLQVPQIKVPSGELLNLPLLLECARSGLPLIVSTGMSTLHDVSLALDAVAFGFTTSSVPSGLRDIEGLHLRKGVSDLLHEQVTLLQCTTAYPAPIQDANLRSMITMRDTFGVQVGFSDHTIGKDASLAAVALGARVIEKHLTLDRNLPGPDHFASLLPEEFAELVKGIRNVEAALGSGEKKLSDAELINREHAQRSLVAARRIEKGQTIKALDLTSKRPGGGISPSLFWDAVGSIADRDFDVDEMIQWGP